MTRKKKAATPSRTTFVGPHNPRERIRANMGTGALQPPSLSAGEQLRPKKSRLPPKQTKQGLPRKKKHGTALDSQWKALPDMSVGRSIGDPGKIARPPSLGQTGARKQLLNEPLIKGKPGGPVPPLPGKGIPKRRATKSLGAPAKGKKSVRTAANTLSRGRLVQAGRGIPKKKKK